MYYLPFYPFPYFLFRFCIDRRSMYQDNNLMANGTLSKGCVYICVGPKLDERCNTLQHEKLLKKSKK